MEEKDYATEIFEYIQNNGGFDGENSISEFKSTLKSDNDYAITMYEYVSQIDSSFKSQQDPEEFKAKILDFDDEGEESVESVEKKETRLSIDTDIPENIKEVNEKYDDYLTALKMEENGNSIQTIEINEKTGEPLRGKDLADKIKAVEDEKTRLIKLIESPESKESVEYAQKKKDVQRLIIPTEEEVMAQVNLQKKNKYGFIPVETYKEPIDFTDEGLDKRALNRIDDGAGFMEGIFESFEAVDPSLTSESTNTPDFGLIKTKEELDAVQKDDERFKEGRIVNGIQYKKGDAKKIRENTEAFQNKNYSELVKDLMAGAGAAGYSGTTASKEKAEQSVKDGKQPLLYIPSLDKFKENPKVIYDIDRSPELMEAVRYEKTKQQIMEQRRDSKFIKDKLLALDEQFEDESGTAWWGNMIAIADTNPIIKATGTVARFEDYIGEGTKKAAIQNKADMANALGLSQKGNDYKIASTMYDLQNEAAEIMVNEARVMELARDLNSRSDVTQKEIDDFNNLRNELLSNQQQILADYEYLGTLEFDGFGVQGIIDKTVKTYDEFQVLSNIFVNSGVRIVTGLGTLANELSTANILEHVGLNIRGEDGEVNQAILKRNEEIFGEGSIGANIMNSFIEGNAAYDQKADELLSNAYEYGDSLLAKNREAQVFDDIDGMSSALTWGAEMLTGQVLNTGMSIVIPGGGGLLIAAASEAGNKMHDMKIEMQGEKWSDVDAAYIKEFKSEYGFNPLGIDDTYSIVPKEYNALEFYGTAAMYGAAEYLTEKITLGNFKMGAKNLRKAMDLSKASKKGITLSNKVNQRWVNLREAAKDFAVGAPGESIGEGVVALTNNIADRFILGDKSVSIFDNVTESMVSGLVMSGTMQGPGLLATGYQAFRGPDRNAAIAKRGEDIIRLSNSIKNKTLQLSGLASTSESHRKISEGIEIETQQMHELVKQQLKDQNKVNSEIATMTKGDRQGLIDIFNAEHKIRHEIDKINDNLTIDPKAAETRINEEMSKLAALQSVKKHRLGNAEWNADKQRSAKLANNWRAKNGTLKDVKMIVAENNDQALEFSLEYVDTMPNLSEQEKNAVKDNIRLQFDGAAKQSRGNATVNGFAFGDNMKLDLKNDDGSNYTKTLQIPITVSLKSGANPTVQSHEIGHHTLFREFVEKNEDAFGLVEDLESYVNKNYKNAYKEFNEVQELYGKYDSKKQLTNRSEIAEEKLARLSDFMRQNNNLEGMRTLNNKLFGRFKKFNDGSGQIKTGKDVFDMLISYNESFEKGELVGLTKSIAEGTATVSRKNKSKKTSAKQVDSNGKSSLTKGEKDQIEAAVNDAPGPRNKDGEYTITQEQWQAPNSPYYKAAYKILESGDLDGLIIANMESGQDIYGQDRESFIEDAKLKIAMHMFNFNPQVNNKLYGWLSAYIGKRVGDVANKAKREKEKQPGVKISTDKKLGDEGGATVADTIKGDDADSIIEAIDAKDAANEQDAIIDNLRTRLGIEKGGELYNKVVQAVEKTFGRTKLKDVTNTEFKQDLKNKLNTELFKEVKNYLGTRKKFEEFINGKVSFTNKDGKTKVMPRWKMLFNYFSQGVVNKRFEQFKEPLINPETGKQARPDNNPLFRKREDITQEEWTNYFLGKDVGSSTKGTRKDALASAIAEELAFDATMEVLEDPNVQKKINEFYELQGLRQAENFTEKVGKKIDREPGSKFSVTNKTNLQQNEVLNEISNLEQFLQGENIVNKIQNGKDLSSLIENYISSKNQDVQDVLNLYSNTLLGIVKDSGKIKIKLPKAQRQAIARTAYLFQANPGPQLLAEQENFKEIVNNYDFNAIDANTSEGKKELIDKIFLDKDSALINFLPESALTAGTLSNGGLNEATRPKKALIDMKGGSELLNKMRNSGLFAKGKPTNSEVERTYTLTDGTKIKNTDPKFLSKDIQLKIAPVGTFLFANALQVKNAIAEAKKRGNTFAPETKTNEQGVEVDKNIKEAVKRQGYSAKMEREIGTPKFTQEQINKRDGFKELMMSLNDAVEFDKAKFLPVVAGLLSSTSGSQNHFGRTGSIVEFGNTLGLKNVEEHTEPASDLMKFLLNRMAQGNLEEYIDPALESFFQGALPNVYDNMLKGTGVDGTKFNYIANIPSEYIADVLLGTKSVWLRYFNPNVNSQKRRDENGVEHKGIDPNVIILSNGKSIAEEFGIGVAKELQTPGIIEVQQKLLFEILDGQITIAEAVKELNPHLATAKTQQQATEATSKTNDSSGVMLSLTKSTNKELIDQASVMDKALSVARDPNAPVKKIRVFDFDDTLARTKSNVLYTMPDGTTGKLTAEEFAKEGDAMLAEGAVWDFSEFNKVMDGKKGPLFEVAKKIQDTRGTEDLFVLTARAQEASPAIKEFLDAIGLNIPLKNISGLGDSSPFAKSNWVVDKAAEGYNDFYFADDHSANVKAVSEAMSLMDVKSKTQLAKQNNIKFSKSLVKKLNWKTDEASNMTSNFKIKDKSYLVRLYPVDKKGDYRYEFELETETGSTQGITGTGNAISVFSTVYNGLVDAINSNSKIKRVEFSADKSEPSRVKVYTSVMERLSKDLGWDTDIWETTDWDGGGSFDFEITKPRKKQPAPVEKVLNVIDVKSETQKAKIKFSKTADQTINDIIEHKFGIKSEKEYSDVKAKLIGRKKGRGKFFIPPSAEDFVGLLYSMLGKGEIGDLQMEYFKDHLIEPYGRAMEDLSRDQNRMVNDFRALKAQLVKEGLIPKNLNKKAFGEFTFQDVARILAWNKQGFEVPGISKADLNEVLKFAKDNPAIDVFAGNLIDINKGDGYAKPGADWLAGTISTDLLDGLRTGKRAKYLEQWQQNVDVIFSEKNLNKMEAAMGSKWREAMENMLGRMKTGKNRTSNAGRLENRLLDYVNNSVGTVMFMNMRSAILQTISSINFINWGSNNILKAGKAFANQPQYWKDFMELMNSEFLVERRNGLKLNVSESEIADAAATSKNKAKAVIAYILQKGYLPTQFADSFAIASGGATFYRNKVNELVKNGMDIKAAEAQAFLEFREIAEESQQSSRPDRISQQQASGLGRVILAFANTPMQYNRLIKKAGQDLLNRRKKPGQTQLQSDFSNVSKMAYYAVIQNVIFNALQQAVFALDFDDEEDEGAKQKYYNVANGMLDSILRGSGLAGVGVSTLLAMVRKVYKEAQKEGTFPGPQYADAAWELLNFAPPIDIKASKLRIAGNTWKYEGWKHDEAKWGIDDPAYKSAAYVISALTNVPLDRLFKKMDNVKGALDAEEETWKRVSQALGWTKWQLETTEDIKEFREQEKPKKKQALKNMYGESNPEVYSKVEQQEILKGHGYSDEEIKAMKREEQRVEAILKKQKESGKVIKPKQARAYTPKKLMTIKQLKQEEEKAKLKKDQETKQVEIDKYKKLKKPRQVEMLDSLGLSKKQIRGLQYEKDRVAKLIELMNK